METEELTIGRVHHGRNIRRTRIEKDMNQEGLSELVHLSQPAVSKYEKMKVIDDEMLQRFARALNVPFDYLKTLEEDAQTVVFENNTVNNSEQSAGGANISMGIVKSDTEDSINDSRVNNFNPIDKITELYERLLKEKDEKYAALERLCRILKKVCRNKRQINERNRNMMKQMPYGITDFSRIQKENYYYVDKTMFIEKIEMQPPYLFLIRPRRFGKSLTLAMLEAYYDVNHAEQFDELFGQLYIGQIRRSSTISFSSCDLIFRK